MKQQVAEKVWEIAEPILKNEGLELVDVEYLREGGRWILRLYIDKPGSDEKGKGVDLEDCKRATHAVETALDVAEVIPQEHLLEVSSPGIERPLTRPEHFQRFLGKRIHVKTYAPLFDPPRKAFTGTLLSFADDTVEIDVEGAGRFRIARKDVAKAHLKADWD